MLTVHHLNDSRSQRILWLLEELGVPYEMKRYQRDATTRLAPPELAAVHPLGKSPIITDGDIKIAESGAIVDYLIRRHGKGKMMPAPGSADFEAYNEWLHYSEGSAMLPLMLNLYVSRLKEAGAPLHPRIDSEMKNHLGYVDGALEGREFFVGQSLTGADIQMSFVAEMAKVFPALAVASWLLMMTINGVLAQGALARFALNRRPSPDIATLTVPRWLLPAIVIAALLALVVSGDLGYLGGNLLPVLGLVQSEFIPN